MEKKPCVAPTLTRHGSAVEMTAGNAGRALALIDFRPRAPFAPPGNR